MHLPIQKQIEESLLCPKRKSHSKRKSQKSSSEDDRPGKRGMLSSQLLAKFVRWISCVEL